MPVERGQRFWLGSWHARTFPKTAIVLEFKGHACSGRLIPVQPHLHTVGMPGSFLIA